MKDNDIIAATSQTKNHYSQFHRVFDQYLDQFMARYPQPIHELVGRSELFIPKTYAVIKRKVASFYETYLSSDTVISVSAYGEDAEQKRKMDILNSAIDYYERKNPYKSDLVSIFYDFYIYGVGVCKLSWRDGVHVARVDPRDFAFDMNARTMKDCRVFVHTIYVTKETLESYGLKVVIPANGQSRHFARYAVDEIYYLENGVWNVASIHAQKVFRRAKLKQLPFACGYAHPKMYDPRLSQNSHNVYGDSECRILKAFQDELNEIRNQARDAVRYSLNPVVLSEKSSGLNHYDWYNASPGDVLSVNALNGIQFAPTPTQLNIMNEIKSLDLEIQEASGVTAYNSGISRAGMLNQTATGMSILTSEGNNKIAAEIKTAHETFFKPFCEIYARLVYMHAPLSVLSKASTSKVTRFDRGDFDFEANIQIEKPGENKELRKQRLIEALQYLGNNPKFADGIGMELMPMLVSANTIDYMAAQEQAMANQPQPQQEVETSGVE